MSSAPGTIIDSDSATLIVRAVLSLGRRLRAERPAGSVSLSSLSILASLHRLGPVPAVRLAAEEGLQPQSLTRLIAGLEAEGLIVRAPGAADRRELIIHLSARGLEVLAADIRVRRQWLERAIGTVLDGDEQTILQRAAEVMLKLAGTDAGPDDGKDG